MADQQQLMQQQTGGPGGIKGQLATKGPSTSTVLAVILLFPIGGFLLLLSGITLTATLIGLAVATPVFILFSPVIVPAVITIGLAVAGFLTSGAFGITALSSMSYIVNYFRRLSGSVPEQMEHAKRRAQDTAGYMGQKAKDVGQRTQEAVGRA